MNQDRLAIKLIIEHNREMKWFQDALAAFKADKDRRTRRAAYIAARQDEWLGKPNRAEIEKRIGEEFDAQEGDA